MAEANSNIAMWKQRLLAELGRDKKKTVILGTLLAVALILGVRFVVRRVSSGGSGPTATAAAVTAPVAGGPSSPVVGPGMAREGAGSAVNPVPKRAGKTQDADITRDIFRPNPEYFPLQKRRDTPAALVNNDDGGEAARTRAKEMRIQEEARALQLEGTIEGAVPVAIINGQVVSAGTRIAGFLVVEVSLRACTVEKEGVKLQLTMRK